jgi:hypothetical protein
MEQAYKGRFIMDIAKRLCQLGMLSVLLFLTHHMYAAESGGDGAPIPPVMATPTLHQPWLDINLTEAGDDLELSQLMGNPYWQQDIRMGSSDVYKFIPTGPGALGLMVLGEKQQFRTMFGGHVNTLFAAAVYNWDW